VRFAAGVVLNAAIGISTVSYAGIVTVSVKNTAGAASEDSIVMLDPLDGPAAATHNAAVIDQVDKQFVPKVSVVRTGTAVTFPNSDRIRHQVYSFSAAKTFNLKLYAGSPTIDVVFDKSGLVVLGCNIHDSMVAFVAVVDTPYFAKIGKSGSAQITAPPGQYRLRIWNPAMSTAHAAVPVTVTKASLEIPLVLDTDLSRDAVAAWVD
jgi:plastocyanin